MHCTLEDLMLTHVARMIQPPFTSSRSPGKVYWSTKTPDSLNTKFYCTIDSMKAQKMECCCMYTREAQRSCLALTQVYPI